MRDVLIRSHDDHAPYFPIDTARCKDVVAALDVGAEKLLVVVEAIAAFLGQKQRRHRREG